MTAFLHRWYPSEPCLLVLTNLWVLSSFWSLAGQLTWFRPQWSDTVGLLNLSAKKPAVLALCCWNAYSRRSYLSCRSPTILRMPCCLEAQASLVESFLERDLPTQPPAVSAIPAEVWDPWEKVPSEDSNPSHHPTGIIQKTPSETVQLSLSCSLLCRNR